VVICQAQAEEGRAMSDNVIFLNPNHLAATKDLLSPVADKAATILELEHEIAELREALVDLTLENLKYRKLLNIHS
jgi:hypothetical protein